MQMREIGANGNLSASFLAFGIEYLVLIFLLTDKVDSFSTKIC